MVFKAPSQYAAVGGRVGDQGSVVASVSLGDAVEEGTGREPKWGGIVSGICLENSDSKCPQEMKLALEAVSPY